VCIISYNLVENDIHESEISSEQHLSEGLRTRAHSACIYCGESESAIGLNLSEARRTKLHSALCNLL
jgi:hypothetical protein